MAQEFKPGEIAPQSGIYTITHDPAHADMPHEVTVIKGRRFPTCRHCKGISFELAHAAKHVGEITGYPRCRRLPRPIPGTHRCFPDRCPVCQRGHMVIIEVLKPAKPCR